VWLDAVDHVVHEIVGGSKAFKRGSLVITLTRRESLSPAGCQLDTGAAFIRAADIYLARRRGGRARLRRNRVFRIGLDHV